MKTIHANNVFKMLFAFLVLATPLSIASAQGLKSPPPATLFMVAKDYQHMSKLEHTVASAIALAKRLREHGHKITFVTDKASIDDVTKAFPAMAGKPNVDVVEMEDATKVQSLIDDWVRKEFSDSKPKTPFGLVIWSDHGEVRNGDLHFLTPVDKTGEGGVNIHDFREKAGKNRLPIAAIIDTCRLPAGEKNPANANSGQPIGGEEGPLSKSLVKGSARHGNKRYCTTVWSTQPEQGALDRRNDLLGSLANGLDVMDGQFRARIERFRWPDSLPPQEKDTDLSLYSWFTYGIMGVLRETRLVQAGVLYPGANADVGTIVASLEGRKPRGEVRLRQPSDDLLSL